MATIKAPFNFVPLSDKVFTPDWAGDVYHDIPFEDGLDGSIDVTITAHSPIFVRNGNKTNEVDNTFCHTVDGHYFIPGTTVKGAIRNVLEIMTNGKLIVDENAQFAQREWNNDSLYTLRKNHDDVLAGWLYEDEIAGKKVYTIEQSKAFYRINHRRLDQYLDKGFFKKHFTKGSGTNINKPIDGEDPKTAFFKYKKLNGCLDGEFRFTKDNEYVETGAKNRVRIDSNGDIRGYIVLTGSPDQTDSWEKDVRAKQKGHGKFYEFVFDAEVSKEYTFEELQFEHFKFIYKDNEAEWKFAEKRMREGGLPIFFRVQDGKIKDLGLAYLYKLPYEKTPYDIELSRQQSSDRANEKVDFAETIFGYIRGEEQLKGRVQFSHFFAQGTPTTCGEKQLILNSPKASYYPIYIKQDGRNGQVSKYKTYNDGELKGFKRYQVRKNVWQKSMNNTNLDSTLIPLAAGTQFKGQINFHNLCPVELGALLSALTFHLNSDKNIYHQLGQGKPYGYGKVKLDVNLSCFDNADVTERYLVAKFEHAMLEADRYWLDSATLKELFTIAHEEVSDDDALFKYMELDVTNRKNEFVDVKGGDKGKGIKQFLDYYSILSKKAYRLQSVIDEDLKNQLKKEDLEKIQAQKLKEEQERQRQEAEEQRRRAEAEAERQRQEAEEQRRKAEAEAKQQAEAEARREARVAGGLSMLAENQKDFNRAKKDIEKYLRDSNETNIPDNQICYLEKFILRMYPQLKAKEQRSWSNFDSAEWKKIKSYVSEEKAKEIFEKLLN